MQNSSIVRVLDLIKITQSLFEKKEISNPRLNAELLLADTLKIPRINLYVDFEKPLNENELNSFREKVKRRINHEPVQYILGYSEFYGLRFKVAPGVLIPRPETELLVDKAIEILSQPKPSKCNILEIGTGSGCISIAIAQKLDCRIDAIDIKRETMSIAEFNTGIHNVNEKINFINKNFEDFKNFNGYELVISNPPYIPIDEYNELPLEIRNYEPRNSLTDEADGLSFYRKIIEISLKSDPKVKYLLEIGDGKRKYIEDIINANNINNYNFYKDLMGIDRVVYFEGS